mgnify:CR=1 FL=1
MFLIFITMFLIFFAVEIVISLYKDVESSVFRAALYVTTPPLADWADACDRLCDGLFIELFDVINTGVCVCVCVM